MKVLYSSCHSLTRPGADARLDVFRQEAETLGMSVIPASAPDPRENQIASIEKDLKKARRVVLGGGATLSCEHCLTLAIIAAKSGKTVSLWGAGMDGIGVDDAAALAAGAKTDMLGAGPVKAELVKSAVNAARFAYVAGPVTKDILSLMSPALVKARAVGDPLLLIDPAEEIPLRIFSSRKPVIAVNWGGETKGGEEPLGKLYNTLDTLSRWFSFLLFPLARGEAEIFRKWGDRLKEKTDVKTVGRAAHTALLAGWLKRCHILIGGCSDSLALACAAGTPFIGIASSAEIYDPAALVDSHNSVVKAGSATLTEDILNLANDIHAHRAEMSSAITDCRDVYRRRLKEAARRVLA